MQVLAQNIIAQCSKRQLNITTEKRAKSSEKLSSGYRINRAADDAAGLSISEKMRSQIRGLQRGVKNAQEGVSLCQVADGALAEVTDMLHRITELSVQSANGINSQEDRQAIQQEISEILQEIDRISDTTTFNEKKLFKMSSENTAPIEQNTSKLSVQCSGTPQDSTITKYDIGASITGGLTINGKKFAWNTITSSSGGTLDQAAAGTYTIKENGLDFTIQVKDGATLEEISKSLDGISVNMTKSGSETKGAVCEFMGAYVEAVHSVGNGGTSMTAAEYFSFLDSPHTITADETGFTLDGNMHINWSDPHPISSNQKTYEEFLLNDAKGSSTFLAFGDNITISIAIGQNATKDSLMNEINGSTFEFQRNGKICYCPPKELSNSSTFTRDKSDWGFEIYGLNQYGLHNSFWKDQGYDPDNLFLNNATSYTSQFSGNSTDLDNMKISLSVDGTQKTDFKLNDVSKATLQSIINQGGSIAKGTKIVLDFCFGDSLFHYDLTANQDTTVDGLIDYVKQDQFEYNYAYTMADGQKLHLGGVGAGSYQFTVHGLEADSKESLNGSGKIWIQSGSVSGDGMFLEIDRMDTHTLGIEDMDVSTEEGADKALDTVAAALTKILSNRSKIGAQQNRLEHTIQNENNIVENTSAAESRIRDADMPEEMVTYRKENILAQAGESILAQANQLNMGILALLK